jgi:hypothetical protein
MDSGEGGVVQPPETRTHGAGLGGWCGHFFWLCHHPPLPLVLIEGTFLFLDVSLALLVCMTEQGRTGRLPDCS